MDGGRTREVDIEVGDVTVQVKDSRVRNLRGQIEETRRTTERPTIGDVPGLPHVAWMNVALECVPIARNEEEIIQMLKELS